MAELYEPGNYDCEVMDYEFTQFITKEGRPCPTLQLYIYPKSYHNNPDADLPNPGKYLPRVNITLWNDEDDTIDRFAKQLDASGFKGGDIATMVAGHSSFADDLRGNLVVCYRKAKPYVNKKGEPYDSWGVFVPSEDKPQKKKVSESEQTEVVEKLRSILNPRLALRDVPREQEVTLTDTPF